MINRRTLLKRLAATPIVGALFGSAAATSAAGSLLKAPTRDYFSELGLRTFINASGTLTALSGSLMPDEVMEAMDYARHHYVRLDDIQDKVGARIAERLGCEAATVTSGCFSAMTLGMAGVMCGMDEEKVAQLPDPTGLKHEVLMPKPEHYVGYVHALTNAGAKIIEVETVEEMEASVNDLTAMIFVLNAYNGTDISHEDVVRIGKAHDIPTMNDCAADVPPVDVLWKYTDMGYDLVTFSGGKGMRGPQSAGLLLGRADLIAAARLHAPPRGETIGRGMKVNKEEVLGMLVALERYLDMDHEAQWQGWEDQIAYIESVVKEVDSVTTEIHVPEIANHVPNVRISWDQEVIPITGNEVEEKLQAGHPSIELGGGENNVGVSVWMMRPGDERAVAWRIREVLEEAIA